MRVRFENRVTSRVSSEPILMVSRRQTAYSLLSCYLYQLIRLIGFIMPTAVSLALTQYSVGYVSMTIAGCTSLINDVLSFSNPRFAEAS
jgi:hypothetical protein